MIDQVSPNPAVQEITTVPTTDLAHKKPSLKIIVGGLILIMVVAGSAAALYLSQISQDLRQKATGCTYWAGGGATEGACDCRGNLAQQCLGGFWSAPNSGACGNLTCGSTAPSPTPVTVAGCTNHNCTSPDGGCIAIHRCDQIGTNGECTVLNPDVVTGPVNAQEEANSSCQCVQVDVLTGGSGSCENGHINGDWSTLIGSSIVCPEASANCSPPPGGTPPPAESPTPSPTPSASPITYFCNSDCTTDRQCKTADNNFFCSGEGQCRLGTNPDSAQCRALIGPMCLNIALVDPINSTPITADPKQTEVVKFACAEVAGVDHYVFRVIEPGNSIVKLNATGRISEPYTITKSGQFYAQCQVCAGPDDLTCNAFEALQ